jgi:hypothetical protein
MSRKRFSAEEIVNKLGEADLELARATTTSSTVRVQPERRLRFAGNTGSLP